MRAKHRHGVHGGEVNAFHIDGVAAVKVGFADLECRLVAVRPTGVVDHHVQPAVLGHGVRDQRFDLIALRHIGCKKRSLSAGAHDAAYHPLALARVNVVDHHVGAFLRQAQRDAFADAAAGACDDDGFVEQPHGSILRLK